MSSVIPQARLTRSLERLSNRGIRPGLDRLTRVARALGNPQDRFPAVLVAGTNGKGSVCALLEAAFRAAGYTTGLYTSPHLIHYTERIRVNNREIDPEAMDQTLEAVLAASRKIRVTLTQFEALTLTAFLHLARQRVDIAIVEVGMGGRWDATNCLGRVQASVITNVDLDHTEWLGPTPALIAREKAGVLRPGVPTVTAAEGSALRTIEQAARRQSSPLYRLGRESQAGARSTRWAFGSQEIAFANGTSHIYTLGLLGSHQVQNAAVALKTLSLMEKGGWHLTESALRRSFRSVRWAGRLELLEGRLSGRPVRFLLDGAHNPAGTRALEHTLNQSPWKNKALTILFGCMKDKNIRDMIQRLAPHAGKVLAVGLESPRSATPSSLRKLWGPHAPTTAFKNVEKALQSLSESGRGNDPVIATGSLYLIGKIKSYFSTGTHQS